MVFEKYWLKLPWNEMTEKVKLYGIVANKTNAFT